MAMAPEQVGIGIRRYFTQPDTHPYETVEWEQREARIQNWKDGTDAFLQPDVEFPVTWSQNATNIVAQKYFRGTLGTAEREHSLRQVIDRVADTITAWGVRDGYFVDDEEADAFTAELKHVLVTQRAAFNSPVWFNIGVKNTPQQASACQPYDALVSTPEGLVPIGKLVEDDAVGAKVFDANGLTKIVATKANGRKPVLRVHTRAGLVLDVTSDHLVWRLRRGSASEFVPAGTLMPGDQLEWHRTDSWGSGEITTDAIAEAALAGWLQSDGFVGQYKGTNRSLTIEAMTVTEAERKWVAWAVEAVFPGAHSHERLVATQDQSLDCRRLRLYGNHLREFIERWGLMTRGLDMTVPESLYTAPLPIVAAYLRSVFQAEGFVSQREVSAKVGLDMISEGIVRGVQQLLMRFGIYSRVRFKADRRADCKGCWSLSIQVAGDRRRFADEIGFIDGRKAEKLEASFDIPGQRAGEQKRLEVERIETLGEMDVYDIQTESGEYLSNNLRVHNCFILAVEDTMNGILNWYREEGTIFKGGSGSGINLSNIRSSSEGLKGGGTASGPVSFMRGADASAGTIKCLHADTAIVTERGVVPIHEVRAGDHVLTRLGYQAVAAVHDNGVRSLVRVRTALGDEILCTPEHRFRVRGHDGEIWREAGELRPHDHVIVDLAGSQAGQHRLLKQVAPGHHREIAHDLPTVLDEAFGLWLGWVYGDGSITTRPSAKFVAVQIGDRDPELVSRYGSLTRAVFGESVHLYEDRHTDRPDASTSVRFSSGQVVRFLERNGLRKAGAESLRVPTEIVSSPAGVRAAFLAGLFEADGHVGNGYPQLSTVSADLARDVHRLLLSLGIPSKLHLNGDRRAALGDRPLHVVRVVGGEGVARFAKLVGFLSERKSAALAAAVERKAASPYETQWFLPHVASELDRIWTSTSDPQLRRALSPFCRTRAGRRMSLLRARALLERFPAELGETSLATFVYGEDLYTTVTIEPAGEGPTFDLTVAGVHQYLVNSVVTHNSGGKTRRAAKMVILNSDHPDIEEFIWCKATEEHKARALRDAGFDMDLDGKDSHSIQYQNANNSVRVTDDFMRAVVDDKDWALKSVTTGDTIKTLPARQLMRQISEATWQCADPGMQFDTTINKWHTAPNTGRINASNPCFTADTFVHTDKGLIRFADLLDRARNGESFGVYTHDATNPDSPAERLELTRPEAIMVTGFNEIVKLVFSNGMELRCTPNHRIFTTNRGYVEARALTPDDQVKVLTMPAPATAADWRLPVQSLVAALAARGVDQRSGALRLPEKWSPELAHYLGWLVGDGCISGDVVSTVYGGDEERDEVLPHHRAIATQLNDGVEPTPSVQANGTVQLRQSRRAIARLFETLGVSRKKAAKKVVPESIYQAPSEIVASFLQGLFDADGCVYDGENSRYVGLASASNDLLVGVQRLLSTFGVFSRIYQTRKGGARSFPYTRKDGTTVDYVSGAMYDLRISNRSIAQFAQHIDFGLGSKAAKLAHLLAMHQLNETDETVKLRERVEDGVELTFNLTEPRNHSYIANGTIVANCSEYMHLDNSACNLASINLLEYIDEGGSFDVEAYRHTVEVMFTAQEILVGNADYPTEKIAETSRQFRQLGLGYANLGALLMSQGLPYDSPSGRAWAASLTALMTGHAYATSARTAGRMGPFGGYADNEDAMLDVLRMHRAEAAKIDEELVPPELLSAAQRSWDEAVELGERYGVRNSQATVLAPTGCLVGGTLVPTERGLVRLGSLGDPVGDQWQDLAIDVLTDEGARAATKFYVNGVEPVVDVVTGRGYRLRGTTKHRVKVVDERGDWVWRRLAEVQAGDRVPLSIGGLVGEPREVALPPLREAHWTSEHATMVPRTMTAELAEFVGYFMGDGSLHSKGLRLCVAEDDFEVAEHLTRLGKKLFGLEAHSTQQQGYTELAFHSVRLTMWWEACGFAKLPPREGHTGKGYHPRIPDAILYSNDRDVYAAFLRGLFEADGTVTAGIPSWTTAAVSFADDVQTVLLALGYPTTRKLDVSGRGSQLAVLRLMNTSYHDSWLSEVGFLSARKTAKVIRSEGRQAARRDYIPVTRAMIDRLAPANDRLRRVLLAESARRRVSRRVATELFERTGDPDLGRLLGFFYDTVASAELGGEEFTYDLSVPENVTYVANGFVSHNTIGLMMDCDTTGIEPDLALTKAKKLVGGGTMLIVNQTIPRALRNLDYSDEQVEEIVNFINEHKTVIGAPGFNPEHLPVFACSMGDNPIHYMGHVTMMGAVQPFLSGAISKCIVGDSLVTTADGLVRIGSLHQGEAPDSFRDEVIEVASLGGTTKTDAFYYGGLRPIREVVLRSGHRVLGTPNHRLLVATDQGLAWRTTSELEPGDYVAVQYGEKMWAQLPARFDDFRPSPPYGSQKTVRISPEMTTELAFLLGAYASEGHTTRSNWTVTITNSVDEVLERVAAAWRSELGIDARIVRRADKCPQVIASGKAVVEFLEHLGAGARASEKRIPDVVLRSPRPMVLSFLQGLALDAYVTVRSAPKWAICVDSPALLDDLQAVLTNLGIVHSRVAKYNREYDKTYGEVYATGFDAQRLVREVPFLEPDKAARAAELWQRVFSGNDAADVIPGLDPRALYELLPKGRSGRSGKGSGIAKQFRFLRDPRTRHVSRRALELVAEVDGVVLPTWLQTVLDDELHFSPVESVDDAGLREVFDVSVPTTHAFVANGVVNHNTVNLPEEATVEELEQLHIEAWRLGLKSVAVYRDNCKVGQPLSTQKKAGAATPQPEHGGEIIESTPERIVERVVEHLIVQEPVRQKLPRVRASKTFSFRVADCHGYVTVGEFEDGRPGELFLRVAKQGSTLAGIMDAFAISVSHGLQYGVPIEAFCEMFTNMRFEPAGMTDDPDIRFASSLVDYIFRRLAVEYIAEDKRRDMGILTVGERLQPTLPGVEEAAAAAEPVMELLPPDDRAPADDRFEIAPDAPGAAVPMQQSRERETVLCYVCGDIMQRAGTCHACPSCGATSGCS